MGDTFHFRKSTDADFAKGTWQISQDGFEDLVLTCPDCGFIYVLNDNEGNPRKIDKEGKVPGSIICPNPRTCGFHQYAILDNWS